MAVVEEAPADPAPRPQGEIEYRLDQQRILARFGMEALRSRDVDAMLRRATALCAEGMGARYCKYLDAPDGAGKMLVHAGVGWRDGVVGGAELGADLASPAGFAFKTGEPVISNHLEAEERFRTPALLAEHGIKRAINVLVEADGKRYGVIEVDSPNDGRFDEDDLAFMQGFANLIGVAIERQHAEHRLNDAIAHQELLIREASHRVKNSLSLVSAMLNLQMQEDDDPRVVRLLGDAQARIAAIAQTHDQLWRGDRIGIVALDDLACGLVAGLSEQAPQHRITCVAETIAISADTAIPLGLILTELVTNAIKYAGGDREGARIDVTIGQEGGGQEGGGQEGGGQEGGTIVTTVTDDGPGMPADFDIRTQSKASLGMRMVASLARQLGGTIAFLPGAEERGTRVRLTFPDPRLEPATL